MPMKTSALISVGVHLAAIVLVSLLMGRSEVRAEEEIIPIRLVTLQEQPPQAPTARIVALKPGPAPGPERQEPRAPAGGIHPEAAKPKQPPAPPEVLTSQGGETEAAKGKAGATGTEGTGTEPAGPSYGPGVEPGPLPVYPKNALDQNLEGTVTLTVTVSPEGKAAKVQVTGSSGYNVLDGAAQRSVSQWTFKPGMKEGKPAGGEVVVTIRFAKNAVEQL